MVVSDVKVAFLFHSAYCIIANNVEICLLCKHMFTTFI